VGVSDVLVLIADGLVAGRTFTRLLDSRLLQDTQVQLTGSLQLRPELLLSLELVEGVLTQLVKHLQNGLVVITLRDAVNSDKGN
jgi:hypothetical protein